MIRSIVLTVFGFVTVANAQGGLLFTDQTLAAGVTNDHSTGFFEHSDRVPGAAIGDFDRDGWQDIYVVRGGASGPDRLFMNNGDGTFTDEAAAWGLTENHMGKGVSVADYDGDGWQDVFVTSAGPYNSFQVGHHKLYHNNGDGTFTNVAAAAGVNFTTTGSSINQDGFGSAWSDYDLDGDLDLFVGGFRVDGNVLFSNNGDGTFTNVTVASELFLDTIQHRGSAPRFLDVDDDRYPELLLVSEFGTSIYWKNDGDGTFTEWTDEAGLGHEERGQGQCVGDFDGDGALDFYVTSVPQNKLYLTQPNGTFLEASSAAAVNDGGYGRGCLAIDFDHDTWVDIAETNGGLALQFSGDQSYLWLNNGDVTFTEVALAIGFSNFDQGRGMCAFDYDNDGDQDVVIVSHGGPLQLLRNDLSGTDVDWLRVFLDNDGSPTIPPDGIGSKVYVTAGGTTQVDIIDGGDNFCSHSELSAHFGLGAASAIDEVRVEWTDGTISTLTDVTANQTLTILASSSSPNFIRADANADGLINIADAISVLFGLFVMPEAILCGSAADANDDGAQDLGDAIYILTHTFSMGAAPPAPFPSCGTVGSPFSCDTTSCP